MFQCNGASAGQSSSLQSFDAALGITHDQGMTSPDLLTRVKIQCEGFLKFRYVVHIL